MTWNCKSNLYILTFNCKLRRKSHPLNQASPALRIFLSAGRGRTLLSCLIDLLGAVLEGSMSRLGTGIYFVMILFADRSSSPMFWMLTFANFLYL